jgi:hypothetical protein
MQDTELKRVELKREERKKMEQRSNTRKQKRKVNTEQGESRHVFMFSPS